MVPASRPRTGPTNRLPPPLLPPSLPPLASAAWTICICTVDLDFDAALGLEDEPCSSLPDLPLRLLLFDERWAGMPRWTILTASRSSRNHGCLSAWPTVSESESFRAISVDEKHGSRSSSAPASTEGALEWAMPAPVELTICCLGRTR